ncbi:MAG: alkaline phosphatase PhoX [Pseudomonadota bacterium]
MATSSAFAGLQTAVLAHSAASQRYKNTITPFGPLTPDPNTLLDLPEGFTYRVLSRAGQEMDDGLLVPPRHDGMAAFPGQGGNIILVCNHELGLKWGTRSAFGRNGERLDRFDRAKLYDAGAHHPSPGGTTTLLFNPKTGRVEKRFLSLAGTAVNCAGGPTSWGSWLSCEEIESKAGDGLHARDHGYVFEVPARTEHGPVDPLPIRSMGRFKHEAIAEDPRTGIIYVTEDRHDGLIYRFLPNQRQKLHAGGTLQCLCLTEFGKSIETNNHGTNEKISLMSPYRTAWKSLEDVEAEEAPLRIRGAAQGAALFARGEGMWYGNNSIYFACTEGGPTKIGQLFRYKPSPFEGTVLEEEYPGTLELFLESDDPELLENADNLTISPWGHAIVCEDGKTNTAQFIRGVTGRGAIYTLARNANPNNSEFAGVCFGPDFRTLFVNIQAHSDPHRIAIVGRSVVVRTTNQRTGMK